VSQALTLFTTPVVYLYLDRLSNAISGWGRASNVEHGRALDERDAVKEAAE
jgi:HAE1 family hydrophobic/amphiphilic exporter-1